MEKVSLKELIETLQDARKDFKESYNKEPYIWCMRVDEGEIELCEGIKKIQFGYKLQGNSETYNIPTMSDL